MAKRILNFNESKIMYIFLMILSLFVILGVNLIIYLFTSSLIFGPAITIISIYIHFFTIKIQYQWKFSRQLHIFALISVPLFIWEMLNPNEDIFIYIISILLCVVVIMFLLPLSSYTYSMKCEYDTETGILTINFNKLYMKIWEEYTIPNNSPIIFHSLLNPSFSRGGMFHSIEVDGKSIPLVPLNINGFTSVNKTMQLLNPGSMRIEKLPKTNSKIILPETKFPITLPNKNTGHFDIKIFDEISGLSSFKRKYPRKSPLAFLLPVLLIVFPLGSGVGIAILIILSIMGNIEPAPIDTLIFIIVMYAIIFTVGMIQLVNFSRIAMGRISLRIEDELLIISYQLMSFTPYEIRIHEAFNPRIRIENNYVDLVIVADPADTVLKNYTPYFYELRLGKISSDDAMMITINM